MMAMDRKYTALLFTLVLAQRLRATSVKFDKESYKKLDHVFYSLSATSSIECCRRCLGNSTCTAVNYSPRFQICELNNDKLTKTSHTEYDAYYRNSDTDSSCESPWVWFNNYCYLVEATARPWQLSEDYCTGLSGHLVSIHSEVENTFVRNEAGAAGVENCWIGMYIEWPAGDRSWTSGDTETYDNFHRDEPNNNMNSENCAEMAVGGNWNDNYCLASKSSVCKRPAQ